MVLAITLTHPTVEAGEVNWWRLNIRRKIMRLVSSVFHLSRLK